MCIAMNLPPWLSRELIKVAGFGQAATERQRAYEMVLECMYTASVDEVQAVLSSFGDAPLKL